MPKRPKTSHVGHVLGLRDARGTAVEHSSIRDSLLDVFDSKTGLRGQALVIKQVLRLVALIQDNQRPRIARVSLQASHDQASSAARLQPCLRWQHLRVPQRNDDK